MSNQETNNIFCSVQKSPDCDSCTNRTNLMCRYDPADTLHFFMIFLPLLVSAVGGVIVTGNGMYLWGWLAYAIFFFFIWEANVLCSHCPYWSEPSRILHCHANYGVFKFFRYKPQPMSQSEQIQFIVGALILALYPVGILVVARQFLLAGIATASVVSFGYLLYRNICVKCVNFSCPLNHVSESYRSAYQKKNAAEEVHD